MTRLGITTDELCKRYPVLYHMASHGAWSSIAKHGLLSTAKLLDLFEVPEPRRTELLTLQRRECVKVTHPHHGTAVLRDQKPLSAKNLVRCLVDCTPAAWFAVLNERVFFWLHFDRLMTLMSAAEYREKEHTVIRIDTARLLSQWQPEIQLAHMNTGNTLPMPHRRGLTTFRSMEDYDYERRRNLPDYSAVVELTVMNGVPDIQKHVTGVEHAVSKKGSYQITDVLFRE